MNICRNCNVIIYDDTENTYEPGTEGETIIQ